MKIAAAFVILMLATLAVGQTSIGPFTIDAPPPNLPQCKPAPNASSGGEVCTEWSSVTPGERTASIWNFPYPDACLQIDLMDVGTIQHIEGTFEDAYCVQMSSDLRKKFGVPMVQRFNRQNAFGARWTETSLRWNRKGVHVEFYLGADGCALEVQTPRYYNDPRNRVAEAAHF
jgi:hypothetical protein